MSVDITHKDAPFGTLLGYAPGGVAIYSSNYSTLDPRVYPDEASLRSYIDDEYMGHKWQCVEFARRFLFLNYGVVFTDVGMAYEIFSCVFCAVSLTTACCHCRPSPTVRRGRRSPVLCLSGKRR